MMFWNWMNGKKTAISAIAGVLLAWVQVKGWVDKDTAMMLAGILTVLTGVGVGHKITKGAGE